MRKLVLVYAVGTSALLCGNHAVAAEKTAAEIEAAEARRLLIGQGLTPAGSVWINRQEAELRRTIESLESLERRHHQATTRAEQSLRSNESIRAQLLAAEAAQAAGKSPPPVTPSSSTAGKSPSSGDPAKKPEKLTSQLADVTGLGEQTPLQQAMIELVGARTALQLAILQIKRQASPLEDSYKALQENAELKAALAKLSESARLGPVKNYQRGVQHAETLVAAAFPTQVPGYFESGQFRVAAILNDSQPATLGVTSTPGPLLLSYSVLERLGNSVGDPKESPREVVVSGRKLLAQPIVLESFRLGACLIKSVPALVLPADAEDLGSTLPLPALTGYQTTLDERRMSLTILPDKGAGPAAPSR